LAEEEVGRLTLAEYEALLQRKIAADDRAQLNAGIVASAVINSQGGINGKPSQPVDFVPHLLPPPVTDLAELTPEEQKEFFFKLFGNDPNGKSIVQVKG